MPLGDDVDLDLLAERTKGYTGADLEDLVRRAGLHALREDMEATVVPMRLFERALDEVRASVTPEMERDYERIADELKQRAAEPRRIGFAVQEARGPAEEGKREEEKREERPPEEWRPAAEE
jgi:transitional endoplasmic reticulum ATPase